MNLDRKRARALVTNSQFLYSVDHEYGNWSCDLEPGRRGQPKKQPDFDAILEQSIEGGLRHVCGQSGLELVLSLCPLKQVSIDPAVFHKVLRDVFKESGAVIIEREVARRLLQSVGDDVTVEGDSRRSWLATARSGGKESGRGSKKENDVLRQFPEPESLPKGHARKEKPVATPIDLTVAQFAYAFKKGS
jgi:hypothetical protein